MKSILLLEDEPNLNRGISLKLEKEGYNVLTAFNVHEAKLLFDNHKGAGYYAGHRPI